MSILEDLGLLRRQAQIQQEEDDRLVQERLLAEQELLLQQSLAEQLPIPEAVATTPVPIAAPAATVPQAPAPVVPDNDKTVTPGTEEYIATYPKIMSYLGKQTQFPTVKTAKDFLNLPTDVRKQIVDSSVDDDAKTEGWDATKVAEVRDFRNKYLTYGDMKNYVKPSWGTDDFVDKFISSGSTLVNQAKLSFGNLFGNNSQDAAKLYKEGQTDQEEIAKEFSSYTKDMDRKAAWDAAEDKRKGESGVLSGLERGLGRLARNPVAEAGAVVPNILTGLAAVIGAKPIVNTFNKLSNIKTPNNRAGTIAKVGTALAGGAGAILGAMGAGEDYNALMSRPVSDFESNPDYIKQTKLGKTPEEAKAYVAWLTAYEAKNVGGRAAIGAVAGATTPYLGGLAAGAGTGLVATTKQVLTDIAIDSAEGTLSSGLGMLNEQGVVKNARGLSDFYDAAGENLGTSVAFAGGTQLAGKLSGRNAKEIIDAREGTIVKANTQDINAPIVTDLLNGIAPKSLKDKDAEVKGTTKAVVDTVEKEAKEVQTAAKEAEAAAVAQAEQQIKDIKETQDTLVAAQSELSAMQERASRGEPEPIDIEEFSALAYPDKEGQGFSKAMVNNERVTLNKNNSTILAVDDADNPIEFKGDSARADLAFAVSQGGFTNLVRRTKEVSLNNIIKSNQEVLARQEKVVEQTTKVDEGLDSSEAVTFDDIIKQIEDDERIVVARQKADIAQAKLDIDKINNGDKTVIEKYVKAASTYKLITDAVIEKNKNSPIIKNNKGSYYYNSGAKITIKTADQLAIDGATKKANSKPKGQDTAKYAKASLVMQDLMRGKATVDQAKAAVERAGLKFTKHIINKKTSQSTTQSPPPPTSPPPTSPPPTSTATATEKVNTPKAEPSAKQIDTYFGTNSTRGNAPVAQVTKLQGGSGKWKAVYITPEGESTRGEFLSATEAQAWVSAQDPQVDFDIRQVGSKQLGEIRYAVDTDNIVSPAVKPMALVLETLGVPTHTAHATAIRLMNPIKPLFETKLGKWLSSTSLSTTPTGKLTSSYFSQKYSPLDAIRKRVVRDASFADQTLANLINSKIVDGASARQNVAMGVRERSSSGNGIDVTTADHIVNVVNTKKDLMGLGVDSALIENYAYALSSIHRDEAVSSAFPTDISGRARDPDASKFSFFVDGSGKLQALQPGLVSRVPFGLTKIEGEGAGAIYMQKFVETYPNAAGLVKQLAQNIKDLNDRDITLRQLSGRISTTTAAQLRAQPYYLTMKQLDDVGSSTTARAKGRSTSAVSPLDQRIVEALSETTRSFNHLNIKEFGEMLRASPMPDIATINSAELSLEPTKGETSLTAWRKDNRFGKDAVSYFIGNDEFVLSIKDNNLKQMFRPDATSDAGKMAREYILPTLNGMQRFSSFVWTATGAQLLKNLVFDNTIMYTNVQGAAGRDIRGEWFVPTKDANRLAYNIFKGSLGSLKYGAKKSMTEALGNIPKVSTTTVDNLAAAYYEKLGGGINMQSALNKDFLGTLEVNRMRVTPRTTGLLNNLADLTGTGFDIVSSAGHINSIAIRLSAFKEFVKLHNGGNLPTTPDVWQNWVDTKPTHAQTAVKFSKEIVTNFENRGAGVWASAIIPFFNATMRGSFSTMPQVMTSPHGLRGLLILAGVVSASAASYMKDSELDEEGKYKWFRNPNSYKSLAMGNTAMIPIAPELAVISTVTVWSIAKAAHLMGNKKVDMEFANKMLIDAAKGMSPAKTAPFDEASIMSLFGLPGQVGMILDGMNATGVPFGQGKRAGGYTYPADGSEPVPIVGGNALPDFAKWNDSNTSFQVTVAKQLNNMVGVDVTPDSVKAVTNLAVGGWGKHVDAYQKAYFESGGDRTAASKAAVLQFMAAYTNKENEYAIADSLRKNSKALTSGVIQGKLRPDVLTSLNKLKKDVNAVKDNQGWSIRQLTNGMANAKIQDNPTLYKELNERRLGLRKQVQLLNGSTIKMIESAEEE